MAEKCLNASNTNFGPVSHQRDCRPNFDFTLLFEQSVLAIGPTAILLALTGPRVAHLWKSSRKTLPSSIRYIKTSVASVLLGAQIALLVLWSRSPSTKASIPAAALSVAAALAILLLSALEHSRTLRPSSILNVYLLFSAAFDAVQVRTLYLRKNEQAIASLSAATVGIKLLLLILEALSKRGFLQEPYRSFSPESTSGIVNRSFFWWLSPIFLRGMRKVLTLDDLFVTDQALLTHSWLLKMEHSWDKYRESGQYSLIYAVLHCFRWQFITMMLPRLAKIGFTWAQPFLISSVINNLVKSDNPLENSDHYGLIGATALIYGGIAISTAHYEHLLYRMITCFRGSLVALIYEQTLRLGAGQDELAAVTLMSTDIDRLAMSLSSLNEMWAQTVEIALGIWLLERQLGWVCVAPIAIVVACVIASIQVSKFIGSRQKTWMAAIQRRVALTSSMLAGMKSIKMMGLSSVLFDTLQAQRTRELDLSKSFRVLGLYRMLISFVPPIFGPFLTFVIFAGQAEAQGSSRLTTAQIFSSLSIISLLTGPASTLLQSLPLIAMSTGCFERIQTFLWSAKYDDKRILDVSAEDKAAVAFDKVSVSFDKEKPDVLSDITLSLPPGRFHMILGPVGSGKSALIKTVIGELQPSRGRLHISQRQVAYCAQSPWLPNGSIQEIICGPGNFDPNYEWYNEVKRACALDEDISSFAEQDQTSIGSRGISLSGGQKQRVALARAVYSRKSIIVLDDIFSALDANTETTIVRRLLDRDGLLRKLGCTVLLATHSLRHLESADKIIVLNQGKISEHGSFEELRSRGSFVGKVPVQLQLPESEAIGTASQKIPKSFLGPSANDISDLTRRTGDLSVYKYYLASIGWFWCLASGASALMYTIGVTFPSLWLGWYGDGTVKNYGLFAGIYTISVVTGLLFAALDLLTLYMRITPKSGVGLHKRLLLTVLHAPQSFFDRTDSGVTLNRFSQDMTLIDGSLPSALVIFLTTVFECLAKLGLIATGSSYMALSIPVLVACLYLVQKVYLQTSRQMRFLDLEYKSPLFTNLTETIDGLSAIRAFGWEHHYSDKNMDRLDTSQRPYYLMYCIQRWLNLVLQLLTGAIAVLLVALALNLRGTTSANLVGVSLSSVVGFNESIVMAMLFWTQLETSLGAVARLKTFEKSTESENTAEETFSPAPDWPSNGNIEFKNVFAKYRPDENALQDISLKISAGEKFGICGRTGSGKSTLVSVLLRILDTSSGTLIIDDINLQVVPRETIRSRLITIPQDPFFLTGTVRLNMDPTKSLADKAIVDALVKVDLWRTLETRGGLDADMKDQPLSKGQQQLLCLARAILKSSSRILILDEPTSNMDMETDEQIHEIIRKEFSNHTSIIISHRLGNMMTCDKICVMENGYIVECGSPQELSSRSSKFKEIMGV